MQKTYFIDIIFGCKKITHNFAILTYEMYAMIEVSSSKKAEHQ